MRALLEGTSDHTTLHVEDTSIGYDILLDLRMRTSTEGCCCTSFLVSDTILSRQSRSGPGLAVLLLEGQVFASMSSRGAYVKGTDGSDFDKRETVESRYTSVQLHSNPVVYCLLIARLYILI